MNERPTQTRLCHRARLRCAAAAGVRRLVRYGREVALVRRPRRWQETVRELDFRVGGLECLSRVWPGGKVSTFESRYQDIVPDQRIVYA